MKRKIAVVGVLVIAAAVVCMSVLAIQAAPAQNASAAGKPLSHGKFIQTFTIKQRITEKLVPGDEKALAKFDLLMMTRNWATALGGNTVKAIHDVNPKTVVCFQTEGPTLWKESADNNDVMNLKDVGRYDKARGHSMGAINKDHPEFFLLNKQGTRCLAYKKNYKDRFLMDFGNPNYAKYWAEAITLDVVKQPWRPDGLHIDNIGPICTFETETPVKYDTDEKWCAATLIFVDNVTAAMHKENCKVWINAGGTADDKGWKALLQLDGLKNPPDVVGEEVAFCHSAGKADTTFMGEAKWKHQVDFMSKLRKSSQAFFSHTKLSPDGTGSDNFSKPVTFWDSLWYGMCSYLLGKDDELNNSYFLFEHGAEKGSPSGKDFWHDEYDHIDLGKAAGPYKMTAQGGTNIYSREFAKGFVFVNPTEKDAAGIALPAACRQLSHENFKNDPKTLPEITKLDLKSHRGTILLKAK